MSYSNSTSYVNFNDFYSDNASKLTLKFTESDLENDPTVRINVLENYNTNNISQSSRPIRPSTSTSTAYKYVSGIDFTRISDRADLNLVSTSGASILWIVGDLSDSISSKVDDDIFKGFIEQIFKFAQLEENWDGYGGVVPNDSTIGDAVSLLKGVPRNNPPSRVGLSGDGEISLIWESDNFYADFGVMGDGNYSYFMELNKKKLYGDDLLISDGFPSEVIKLFKSI